MSEDVDSLYWKSVEEPYLEEPTDLQLALQDGVADEQKQTNKQLTERPEKAKYAYKPKEVVWTPDVDYAKTLSMIQSQRTPAELYRQKLETVGRRARDMQRLEWRWGRDISLWIKSASRVKAGWRGMKGRRYFKSIRDSLVIKREQREVRRNASSLYDNGDIYAAAELISQVKNLTPELQFMKCQCYYQLQHYSKCISSCKHGIGNGTVNVKCNNSQITSAHICCYC